MVIKTPDSDNKQTGFCPRCGHPLKGTIKYCPKCGYQLSMKDPSSKPIPPYTDVCPPKKRPEVQPIKDPAKPSSNKKMLILIAVVAIIAIAAPVVCIKFFHSSKKENVTAASTEKEISMNTQETSEQAITESAVVPGNYSRIYHLLSSDCNIRRQPDASSDLVEKIASTTYNLYFYGNESPGVGSDGQTYIWYNVTLENAKTGWIRSDLVIPSENPQAVYVLKEAGKNIRIMPTHNSGLLTEITDTSTPMYYYGEAEEGLGSDGNYHLWLKIYINNNQAGWVRSDFVTNR